MKKKIQFHTGLFAAFLMTGLFTANAQEVKIGSQTWSSKNLDVAFYRNGDPIPQVTDTAIWGELKTGAWCYYENDAAMGKVYGKLYNWYAVNDPRGLAPAGWHIPSDKEWNVLENTLGGSKVAGGKMKEAGMHNWRKPNTAGDNSSGFAGLPGGNRDLDGYFEDEALFGYWWSSTMNKYVVPYNVELHFNNGDLYRTNFIGRFGFSVRCVKD